MAKYVNTTPIEAEQFDGSKEMIDRYSITVSDVYELLTPDGSLVIISGDWIATEINGEHWPIADDVFRKTYAELPVIPKAVADTIEQVRKINGYELGNLFFDAMEFDNPGNCADWIASHQDEIARAWLDGYQVEEDE